VIDSARSMFLGDCMRKLLLAAVIVCLTGCDTVSPSDPRGRTTSEQADKQLQKLANLNGQKADAEYEIQLRQDEMDQMEATVKKPGVVGVSNEWIQRHNRLKEDILELKAKVHDLELRIDAASKQGQ
jgi:peptidoglycan hydrolase CwlO-like protein